MLRQMESVLCGRFAVTNKIADNLPFSPHRQQKTSIIVDFHGAALMCHIPAFELHVKIKFNYAKPLIEEDIKNWQKKLEFEKQSEWKKRVTAVNQNLKVKELTKEYKSKYLTPTNVWT